MPVMGRRLLLLLLVAAGLSVVVSPAAAAVTRTAGAGRTAEPVLAGCEPDYPPYCVVGSDGHADGFSVELLRAALKAVGREVAFRTAPWPDLRRGLAEGTIQALPLVGRTPEREATYDFTFPYLTMHGTIVVRADNTDIHGTADLNGKYVAVLQGDNAEEYLRRANLGAVVVPLSSFETALRELAAGKHDAVVIQKLVAFQIMQRAGLTNLRTVGPPLADFTQSICFAVREGDHTLLTALNEGLAIVVADGTLRQLSTKWFSQLQAAGQRKSRIVVGGDSDYPPYEFLDANGQPAGFNVDLTRAIARRTGLNVEIRLKPWDTVRRELEIGQVDILQGMFYSLARDREFSFSPPHTLIQHAVVVRDGTPVPANVSALVGRSILVQRGDLMHDFAIEHGLGSSLVPVESPAEALKILSGGRHDCALLARIPALYRIEHDGWRNLTISTEPVLQAEYCYAALHGNEHLLALFSEGIGAITLTGEYRQIQAKWLASYDDAPDTWSLLRRHLLVPSLVLLALALATMLWTWSLRRTVRLRTTELTAEIAQRTRAEDEARRSEQLFRLVFENSPIGKSMTGVDGSLRVNRAFCAMVGYDEDELRGLRWQDITHPDDIAATEKIVAELVAGDTTAARFEKRYLHKSGHVVWADVRTTLQREPDGTPRFFITTINNITDRKEKQARIEALGRLLRMRSEVSALIVREKDRGRLLAEACLIAVEVGSFRMAWVGFADEASGEVRVAAKAGFEDGYLDEIRVRCDDTPLGRGPTGTAIRERRPIVAQDWLVNFAMSPWLEAGTRRGYRSSAAFPIVLRATAPGALMVYAGTANYFEPEVAHLLEQVALDLGWALDAIDASERGAQAEAALRESQARLGALFEANPTGLVLVDTQQRTITEVNRMAEELIGRPRSEIVGQVCHGFLCPAEVGRCPVCDLGQTVDRSERVLLRADGTRMPILKTAVPVCLGSTTFLLESFIDITERKRAEDYLRASELRFQTLAHYAPVGIYSTDADGATTYVNPRWCEIAGISSERALGHGWLTAVHPDDRSHLGDVWAEAVQRRVPSRAEYRFVHADGRVRWVIGFSVPQLNPQGSVLGYIGTTFDITDRKLAEEAVRESEHRYRLIAENTDDVIWTLDLASRRFTYVSPSVEKLRGFTPEEVMAQPLEKALTATSFARVEAMIAAVVAAGDADPDRPQRAVVELEQPTKDGGEVATEVVATRLTDADGRTTGVLGVTRDIRERRRAEQALRDSEERFRSLYENATIGLYRTTPAGGIVMANPTLVRMLGYDSLEDLAARNLEEEGFHPTYARRVFVEAIERAGEVYGWEAPWTRRDGTVVHVRESARAVRDETGTTRFYDGTVEDVSERVRAEEALRLKEEQLRQAQKMEAVGSLAGGVAHDFNNLLQAMLSQTQFLKSQPGDAASVAALVRELEQQIQRGAALTRQLLLFSRQETAKPERLDLNDAVRDAVGLLRRLVRANIALDLALADRPLPVEVDRGQLQQVVMNLTVNASDAMPDGGALAIRTGDGAEGVWLEVADTGVGIPEEIRSRIFDPFFTTKAVGHGTGLGLSVVHGIVDRHGGTIDFESTPGEGTTFRITLPHAPAGDIDPVAPQLPVAGSLEPARGERVLVVEDEAGAREGIREILRFLGYEVAAVESGEAARALPPAPPFDLLLTDFMLPGVSGAELAAALTVRWPALKVILMSGYTQDEAVRRGVNAGAMRYLQKPFDMTTLARELRAALDEHPA